MKNSPELFELTGKGLAVAQALENYIKDFWLKKQPEMDALYQGRNGISHEESMHFAKKMKAELMLALKQDLPECFSLLGLNHLELTISEYAYSFPRAYLEAPALFPSPFQTARYFIYAPVGYKGDFFKPEGARHITDPKERNAIDNLLLGGWTGGIPLIDIERKGAPMPADFKPNTKHPINATDNLYHFGYHYYFIAKGDSLILTEHYKKACDRYRESMNNILMLIEELVNPFKEDILKTLDEGDELYLNKIYSQQTKPRIEITLHSRKLGGRRFTIPQNPYFILEDNKYIVPNRHTPEGQIFALAYDNLPPYPDINTYIDLKCHGKLPNSVFERFGMPLIVYTFKEKIENIEPPKDAIYMPQPIFNWLSEDMSDRSTWVTPPPAPAEVTAFLESLAQKPAQAQAKVEAQAEAQSAKPKKPKL